MSDQGAPPPLPGSAPPPSGSAPPPLGGSGPAAGGPPPVDEHGQEVRVATPPAAPGPDDEPGTYHATEETRTFPCSNCGSQLEFHIGEQKLACYHCGNIEDIPQAEGEIEERDFRSALDEIRSNAKEHKQLVSGEKEVVCQNCGGHTTFTGTLTSTRCPYCATPIQRDDIHEAPARLPVDGVLPFAVDDKKAKDALEQWINSRWFAPNEFKTYSQTGSFASVYAAYFSYDAEATTFYRGERGDNYTVQVGSGDNRRTETRTRWRHASGQVHNSFTDLTVLANTGLDEKRVRALEPWPTEQIRPFAQEYIAGHLSRTYDKDVEACYPEAEERMQSEIDGSIRTDIGGDKQRIHNKRTSYQSLTFTHLLLPIWLLTVIYEGKPFQVFINGVTGEVQGERPYSKVKIAIAAAVALIVVVAAILIYQATQG